MLKKTKVGDWVIYYKAEILDNHIINAFNNLAKFAPIKANDKRKIIRLASEDGRKNYYLKWHLVNKFADKIRVLFKNKARHEYESCLLLQQKNIPVANYFAWAINLNGETLIISEELPNSQTARSYWYALTLDKFNSPIVIKDNSKLENYHSITQFIDELTSLLKIFVEKKIYHPDLHLGNLLWDNVQEKLFVIDPYGISKKRKFSKKKLFDFIGIIVGLRNYLSFAELVELCLEIKICSNKKEASALLKNYLEKQYDANKDWAKRFKQILAGREKYNQKFTAKNDNNIEEIYYIRCGFNEQILEVKENCLKSNYLAENYEAIEYNQTVNAENIWVNSFVSEYQFLTIDKKPIVMKIEQQKTILYCVKGDLKQLKNESI